MALPNAILFPQALLPLYIFEDRYRRMLEDCLAGHRMFSVALVPKDNCDQPDESRPYDVAGLGIIRAAVGNDDGTSNIILQGVSRIRLLGYVGGKPYPQAQIEPLRSKYVTSVAADPLAQKVAMLLSTRAKLGMALPDHVVKYLTTMTDADNLADLVAFTLLSDFSDKQVVLEMLDVRARQRRLIQLLDREMHRLLCWKKVQGKVEDENIGLN